MLFNSIQFVVFFLVVVSLYFTVPHRFRWGLLLVASCYFYMVFIPWYVLILFFLIIVDFILAKYIAKSEGKKRRWWLVVSIFSNVGTLFVFKYFNFFNANFAALFQSLGLSYPVQSLSLALPIGLSFHTFQSLSYVIEVYKGKYPAERHLGIYALYVMFFPQLVAGPIERPAHMLHQFRQKHTFDFPRLVSGVQRMIIGFFKKIVIADQLAIFVNTVYSSPTEYSGLSLAIATIFFAFQIYCDFSGYCDIAIGAAKVLGFELSENFNAPYLSASISEFWRRWHMSLSGWFRDYVYIPLGGSRGSEFKIMRNLLLTFLLSGLWHGANWTYVIWGGLNGVYLIGGRYWSKFFSQESKPGRFGRVFGTLLTFVLIAVSWIFFRARSVSEAWYILTHLSTGWGGITKKILDADFVSSQIFLSQTSPQFFVALGGIIFLVLFEIFHDRPSENKTRLFFVKPLLRPGFYFALVFLVLALWQGKGTDFIYFQF